MWHHFKDILVEWTRTNSQRAVKTGMAVLGIHYIIWAVV